MRVIVKVGIVSGVVVFALATYAAVALHRAEMAGTQIRNFVQLQIHVRALEVYRTSHGTYPPDLHTVVEPDSSATGDRRYLNGLDFWGHPLSYSTDGMHFALVSLGRDGLADGVPIPELGAAADADKSPCRDNTLDTVFLDSGIQRGCFK